MVVEKYPRSDLLVETTWLEHHLDDPDIRVVDCDPPDAYIRAHIPGSVSVGNDHYLKDPTNGLHVMPPDAISELFGKLGINSDTLVVAYEGRNQPWAARLWWVLNYYGHKKVRILNGGFRSWIDEGRPVTRVVPDVTPKVFIASPETPLIALNSDIRSAIGRSDSVIWDVRSRGEYVGEVTRGNKHAGHIPGAIHLEWNDMIRDDGTGKFKSPEDITAVLLSKGITPDKQVYTY